MKPTTQPAQKQKTQPGKESLMRPQPEIIRKGYKGSGKLKGKVALITGGDSGIGRSVAVHFAREGADVAIAYLNEDQDAKETVKLIEKEGRKALLLKGDLKNETFCKKIVTETKKQLGGLNILVNNAAMHFPEEHFEDITQKQLQLTFETNIYPFFYVTKNALKYLKKDDCIINTSSVTAHRGSDHLVDYASTKGAIVSFTRSLASQLVEKGIRVNAVAPGPIWWDPLESTCRHASLSIL